MEQKFKFNIVLLKHTCSSRHGISINSTVENFKLLLVLRQLVAMKPE